MQSLALLNSVMIRQNGEHSEENNFCDLNKELEHLQILPISTSVTIQVWLLTKRVAYVQRGKNPFFGADKPFRGNLLQIIHITVTMSTP